jgi:hypothetical protein
VRDIPIIFSAPMVRALLAGRKMQTRRILKPQPTPFPVDDKGAMCDVGLIHIEGDRLPRITIGRVVTTQEVRYAVGDRMWVRESITQSGALVGYMAGGPCGHKIWPAEWKQSSRPSIHMPRWASRLTLIVEGVKVERLQDISEADALAEGCPAQTPEELAGMDTRGWYRDLWNSINGPGAWDANPWVVALTFRVVRSNIDALVREAA